MSFSFILGLCVIPLFLKPITTHIKLNRNKHNARYSNVKALNNLVFFVRFLTSLLEDGKRNTLWNSKRVYLRGNNI